MPHAFTGVISAESTVDLLAVADAFDKYGKETQRIWLSAATQQLNAGWTQELDKRPGFSTQQKNIVTSAPSTFVTQFGMAVSSGGTGKLGFLTRQFEFGSLSRDVFSVAGYMRHNKSGSVTRVHRRTARQIPPRSQTGWVVYPAAGVWSTRAFKMAMQILVKVAHDALEGK